jgi:hypothetical protein
VLRKNVRGVGVIPVKTGIQAFKYLDSRFRGSDDLSLPAENERVAILRQILKARNSKVEALNFGFNRGGTKKS